MENARRCLVEVAARGTMQELVRDSRTKGSTARQIIIIHQLHAGDRGDIRGRIQELSKGARMRKIEI